MKVTTLGRAAGAAAVIATSPDAATLTGIVVVAEPQVPDLIVFPSLAWDTFVTIGMGPNSGGDGMGINDFLLLLLGNWTTFSVVPTGRGLHRPPRRTPWLLPRESCRAGTTLILGTQVTRG